MKTVNKTLPRIAVLLMAATALSACGVGQRIADIGKPPDITPITNPNEVEGYQPVRLPMPAPQIAETQPNSLWQMGSRAFFQDQRAKDIGDILTVVIAIDDSATLSNETTRSRSSGEDASASSLLGYEQQLTRVLPEGLDPTSLIDLESDSSSSGSGEIEREEDIQLRVAAIVTQSLPNGNLAIYGRQEVRVNFERRDLEIAGVIRPEDITATNTITYDQIAEARISYGGRGQITDLQQPRYGQQLYDIIFPF